MWAGLLADVAPVFMGASSTLVLATYFGVRAAKYKKRVEELMVSEQNEKQYAWQVQKLEAELDGNSNLKMYTGLPDRPIHQRDTDTIRCDESYGGDYDPITGDGWTTQVPVVRCDGFKGHTGLHFHDVDGDGIPDATWWATPDGERLGHFTESETVTKKTVYIRDGKLVPNFQATDDDFAITNWTIGAAQQVEVVEEDSFPAVDVADAISRGWQPSDRSDMRTLAGGFLIYPLAEGFADLRGDDTVQEQEHKRKMGMDPGYNEYLRRRKEARYD